MRTRNKVVIGGLTILTTAALFGSCVGAAAPPTAPSVSVTTGTATAPLALPATGPLTAFGNGDFKVGRDVVAGTYRSPGAEDGIMKLAIYTIKSATGATVDFGSSAEVNAPILITLVDGQTVEVSGAQPFALVEG